MYNCTFKLGFPSGLSSSLLTAPLGSCECEQSSILGPSFFWTLY